MESILVTGGAGFVGSHAAEYYAKQGLRVTILDDLSRAKTLPSALKDRRTREYNWNYLERFPNVKRVRGSILDGKTLGRAAKGVDVILHAAAQVAVTSSLTDPRNDFLVNAQGTFQTLEAARKNDSALVYCSTNKVYGEAVNAFPLVEGKTRYALRDHPLGVDESVRVDLAPHTPYGASKLAGDLYTQEYGHTYGLKTAVFRMSCIYGTRQFGNEDQGWVSHFILRTLRKEGITIYGDGKQVRDALFVSDLVRAYDAFLNSRVKIGLYNVGGGPKSTTSLLELVRLLNRKTRRKIPITFAKWRPSDQKVYISDVRKLKKELGWYPRTTLEQGVDRFLKWYAASGFLG